ncbi:transcriptional regulator [Pseudomonas weihenstephanensis]|uniref:transcriptional regulator n=1 Tax=Pseudomonas weihenstephanensis TaxID=1608994 RepID=UPI00193C4C48|nr:transcriptional regulator [Pseudomonas weihenstephanensis]MBM1193506.1 transcriptional regulator [Pseudomonas weihenstephanensis]
MTTYNWALIERLLHEVQNGAGKPFTPRVYAEQYAVDLQNQDQPVGDVDELKVLACNYEALLLKQGFIAPRPEDEGGTGENFVLTERGSQLLSLIDSAIPGNDHPLQVLDEQADPLDPATFDALAAKAQLA